MDPISIAFFWIMQALVLVLLCLGAGAFWSLVRGSFSLRRKAHEGTRDYSQVLLKSPLVPPVSTVAVPPDASPESRRFVRKLLDLHFGENEIVVVLDGPSEEEMEIWIQEFHLSPSARTFDPKLSTADVRCIYESRDPTRVVFVDKVRCGAADSWNTAVNVASSPIIGLLDPESEFGPFILLKLIQPMLLDSGETIAVCGGGPMPPAPGLAGQFAGLESLRAWLTRGADFAAHNRVMPIPGSCILARRQSIIAAGGFTGGFFELMVRLHAYGRAAHKPYKIAFLPEPLSYRTAPTDMAGLRQMVAHDQHQIARAYLNRKEIAGDFGDDLLSGLYYDRAVRPKLELVTYLLAIVGVIAGWADFGLVGLLLVSTVGVGILLSMAAVVLREFAQPEASSPARVSAMFFSTIVENLGYRQLRTMWLIAGFRNTDPPEKKNRGNTAQSRMPAVSVEAGKK